MISQQYKVRDINQSAASGSPFASLTLVPVSSGTASPSPMPMASAGVDKPQVITVSGITVSDLEAAGISLGNTITLTVVVSV